MNRERIEWLDNYHDGLALIRFAERDLADIGALLAAVGLDKMAKQVLETRADIAKGHELIREGINIYQNETLATSKETFGQIVALGFKQCLDAVETD